jgi:hypothetical protein
MSLYAGDKRAAFVGMIVTTALLFVIAFTIVKLTNAKYAKHKAEAKTAETK